MTTIYTKPQIDAMAVKIGVKIKDAKTTVTQERGQSTTYAVSQKMITDSLSAFGTAAYKNVGTAAGQLMQVGAGGILGSGYDVNMTTEQMVVALRGKGSTVFRNIAANTSVYKSFGIGLFASVGGNASGYTVSPFGEGIIFFTDRNNAQTTYELWTDKNATKDANGFLRDSNSIAETVVADATGNVAVASIQAGVGAPKIAYKKLTGMLSAVGLLNIPHGLSRDKILEIRVMVSVSDTEFIPDSYSSATAHIIAKVLGDNISIIPAPNASASYLNSKPVKILITYEV